MPDLPNWLPETARNYILHVEFSVPVRAVARLRGVHASTISRQIRRVENARDDPLIDRLLGRFAPAPHCNNSEETEHMSKIDEITEQRIERAAKRILRRLCEHDTYLLVSDAMEKAAVFKEVVPGRKTVLARMSRDLAEVFALREWIAGEQKGNIGIYRITPVGRKALKRLLLRDSGKGGDPFQGQHRIFGERVVRSYDGTGRESLRINLAESPLTLLARKKDRSGAFYLTPDLLEAGERFRADFEAAALGPRVAQNWDRFLTSGATNGWAGSGDGHSGARERFSAALQALGPGLGDIVLRVCCYLEGLERAEKRLGWASRSGKVVLKIALQRLALHYGIILPEQESRAG